MRQLMCQGKFRFNKLFLLFLCDFCKKSTMVVTTGLVLHNNFSKAKTEELNGACRKKYIIQLTSSV